MALLFVPAQFADLGLEACMRIEHAAAVSTEDRDLDVFIERFSHYLFRNVRIFFTARKRTLDILVLCDTLGAQTLFAFSVVLAPQYLGVETKLIDTRNTETGLVKGCRLRHEALRRWRVCKSRDLNLWAEGLTRQGVS